MASYDIILWFLHVSKVATLTQVKAIYPQPYFHMCISVSQSVRNIGIAVFEGIAVFAHLCDVSTSLLVLPHVRS